jgi:hypothetical protein
MDFLYYSRCINVRNVLLLYHVCYPHSSRVKDDDNLLEMSYEKVTQLPSLHTSYRVCTCANNHSIINEATCSDERRITCDIFKSKPLQKHTCYAKRGKRSLQTHLSYIPNNFMPHRHRHKVCWKDHFHIMIIYICIAPYIKVILP